MTLNCTDLSFYIKNGNFIIHQKLQFFEKKLHFPPKELKPIDFRFDVMSFINPCIQMTNFQ